MSKSFKTFLIVFLLSLPFWGGVNILGKNLENFFFKQYYQSPLSVQIPLFYKGAGLAAGEFWAAEEIIPPKFDIEAKAAISVKLDKDGSKETIFEKNSEKILPIASLTKLITAWVVFEYPEYYNFSREVRISKEAIMQEGDFGLYEGQLISINDLLYSMLIESSNDAAFSLAEALFSETKAKSEEKIEAFVALMNLEAKENIGLKNTYFINPTGLEVESKDGNRLSNYSTAKDLVELSKNILLKHPEIFEISKNKSAEIFNNNYLAVNKNIILNDNTVGGKTGWTPTAGGCILLVQKSERDARVLREAETPVLNEKEEYFINVILGTDSSDSRFSGMEKLIQLVY